MIPLITGNKDIEIPSALWNSNPETVTDKNKKIGRKFSSDLQLTICRPFQYNVETILYFSTKSILFLLPVASLQDLHTSPDTNMMQ